MKILLVDDEPELLEQAKILLERENKEIEVITASCAKKALEMLGNSKYDAVVSDYQMPEMDGLEFLEEVREGRDIDIPFIIFTGRGREEVAMEALNLGADRYIQKRGDPKSQYGVLAEAIVHEAKRKEGEKKLKKRTEMLEGMLDGVQDVIAFQKPDHTIIRYNRVGYEMLGMSPEEVRGNKCYELLGRGEECEECATKGALKSKSIETVEKYQPELGRYLKATSNPILDENGEVSFIIEQLQDITEQKETEKELRKSEREKSLILDSADELIAYHDTDHVLIWANESYSEATGESIEDMKGRKCYEAWLGRDKPCEGCPVDRALEDGGPREGEMSPPGEERDWLVRGSPVRDEEGNIIGAIEVTIDISDLKEMKEKYRIITEGSSNGIYLFQDGEFKFVNEAMVEMSGYSLEELRGMNFLDLVHPDYRRKMKECTEKALKGDDSGLPERHEFRAVMKDGNIRWVQLTPSIIEYEGRPAIVGNVADITEQKEMEKELKSTLARLRTLMENQDVGILFEDDEREILYANQKFCDLFDISDAEAVIGEDCAEAVKRAKEIFVDPEGFARRIEELLEKTDPVKNEELELRDGRTFLRDYIPVHHEGKYLGHLWQYQDITERKKIEEELGRKKEKYRAVLGSAFAGIAIADLDENLIFVNDRFAEMLGYERDELIGKNFEVIPPEGEYSKFEEETEKRRDGKTSQYKTRLKKKNGEIIDVMVYGSPYKNADGELVGTMAIITDITEQKETKERLKRYETGVKASGDSIYMMDGDYRYIFANDEHLSRLVEDGRIPEENEDLVMGKRYREIHPEEHSEALEEKIETVKETGEQMTEEYEFPEVCRWSNRTYSPVKDSETGELKGVVIVSKDVTDRKKVEEREKFLHSLLRHDVRNKAQIVRGYLELLEGYDLPEEAESYVIKAEKGIEDSMELIEKVRILRNIDREEEVDEVFISPMIKNVISEREPQARERDMEIICGEIGCKVLGGFLLEELFSNLIENAIQHSQGSEIRVTSRDGVDECVITVEDDGRGISDGDKERILERGFRSGITGGSGLGMYLVRRIVDNYDGDIEVKDSELGGARFDVRLKKA